MRELTSAAGVRMHLDGARLWNAHVATGTPLSAYGELFDTVSVCLSKGLGAPIGSVLVSSTERVAEGRVWRKRQAAGCGRSASSPRPALCARPQRRALGGRPRAGASAAQTVATASRASSTPRRRDQHRRARGARRSCGRRPVPRGGRPGRCAGPDASRVLTHLESTTSR
jgi:threonine aldolase